MRTSRTVALTAAAAAITSAFALAPAQAATHPAAHHAFAVQSTLRYTYVGDKALPGDNYAATIKAGRDTIKVAAPAGSTVVITMPKGSKHASAKVVTPNLKKTFRSGMAAASAYSESGASIVANAEAVGFTPAQAAKMAKAYGEHPMYSVGSIISTPCASTTGDAGNAWGRACDVQKMLQDNGGGNWYVGDQVTGSGDDHDWADVLTGLAGDVNYGGGNSIVEWSPNSGVHTGSCITINAGVSWNGISMGASQQVCPDVMDIDGGGSSTVFGGHWSGSDTGNITEGVVSSDVVNDPSNASSNPGLSVTIWWA